MFMHDSVEVTLLISLNISHIICADIATSLFKRFFFSFAALHDFYNQNLSRCNQMGFFSMPLESFASTVTKVGT